MDIAAISGLVTQVADTSLPARQQGQQDGVGFGDSLTRLIGAVDTSGKEANAAVSRMMDGSGDVYEAMIALQTAELTFQMTMQVRNKLVNAYQEIMRMPV